MELHYWEKQLILATKGHFGSFNKEILKEFPARYYGFSVKQVSESNILHMVTELFKNLVAEGHIRFDLGEFLSETFRKKGDSDGKISVEDIYVKMLSEISAIKVLSTNLDLGEPDKELLMHITETQKSC